MKSYWNVGNAYFLLRVEFLPEGIFAMASGQGQYGTGGGARPVCLVPGGQVIP